VSEGRIGVPPVVREARVYVANLAGELKALDGATGGVLWTLPNGGLPIVAALSAGFAAPHDDLVAVIDVLGRVSLARDEGGAGVWQWSGVVLAPGVQATSVVLDDVTGHVFAGGSDGRVHSIDVSTGAVGPTRTASSSGDVRVAIQPVSQGGDAPFSLLTAGPDQVARFCAPFEIAAPVPMLPAGGAALLALLLAGSGARAARPLTSRAGRTRPAGRDRPGYRPRSARRAAPPSRRGGSRGRPSRGRAPAAR
jgi:hypothetical protein